MTDLQLLDRDRQQLLDTIRDCMTRPEHWFAAALDLHIESTIRSLRQLQGAAAFARNDPATRL